MSSNNTLNVVPGWVNDSTARCHFAAKARDLIQADKEVMQITTVISQLERQLVNARTNLQEAKNRVQEASTTITEPTLMIDGILDADRYPWADPETGRILHERLKQTFPAHWEQRGGGYYDDSHLRASVEKTENVFGYMVTYARHCELASILDCDNLADLMNYLKWDPSMEAISVAVAWFIVRFLQPNNYAKSAEIIQAEADAATAARTVIAQTPKEEQMTELLAINTTLKDIRFAAIKAEEKNQISAFISGIKNILPKATTYQQALDNFRTTTIEPIAMERASVRMLMTSIDTLMAADYPIGYKLSVYDQELDNVVTLYNEIFPAEEFFENIDSLIAGYVDLMIARKKLMTYFGPGFLAPGCHAGDHIITSEGAEQLIALDSLTKNFCHHYVENNPACMTDPEHFKDANNVSRMQADLGQYLAKAYPALTIHRLVVEFAAWCGQVTVKYCIDGPVGPLRAVPMVGTLHTYHGMCQTFYDDEVSSTDISMGTATILTLWPFRELSATTTRAGTYYKCGLHSDGTPSMLFPFERPPNGAEPAFDVPILTAFGPATASRKTMAALAMAPIQKSLLRMDVYLMAYAKFVGQKALALVAK